MTMGIKRGVQSHKIQLYGWGIVRKGLCACLFCNKQTGITGSRTHGKQCIGKGRIFYFNG